MEYINTGGEENPTLSLQGLPLLLARKQEIKGVSLFPTEARKQDYPPMITHAYK